MSYIPLRRIFWISLAIALLIVGVLAGCALNPVPDPTPTPLPPTPTPLPRGGNLTIRLAADVPDLRPWQPRSRGEEQVISVLYNGLMRLDASLQPQPDLAQSWAASADGRVLTFTLRPDVSWHDGKPLTTDDVVYTLNALREISPTTALLSDLRRITNVTAPTSNTVVLALNERYAPILCDLAVPILPGHLFAGKNIAEFNFWDKPVGTGPFKFIERQPGVSITFGASDTFYRGPPLLDRIAFLVAPDAKVAAQALGDGRLLLAELPWNVGSTITRTVKSAQTGFYPENGYYYLAFNTREGHTFADPAVRQALSAAVNVPELVQKVTGGQGIPLSNSAAPGSWASFTAAPTATADLDRARALLDQAGWRVPEGGGVRQRDGTPLAAQIFVRGDDERRVAAAQQIASVGATIGMSLTVEPADFNSVILPKYAPPYDFDLLLGSWSNGAGDPAFGDYLFYDPSDFALFHSSQINQGTADTRATLNFVGFSDSAYDNQAAAAQQIYNMQQRSQALKLAQERIATLKPYLFLWTDRIPVALSGRITTLDGPVNLNTPLYLWNVERWYLKK